MLLKYYYDGHYIESELLVEEIEVLLNETEKRMKN